MTGAAWAQTSKQAGVPIEVFVIGPGQAYEDLFGDWGLARKAEESGCILVRPDMHVAWRAQNSSRLGEAE
ncbi:hypothetical protein [Roseomonas chloroacetimidivorans]|uniref:aromatic-ring hydroxylase C-terminal domain-containing protein n=1 Tax=Roseomonas chloroacetimidivorans TaxID=1766656 RepID=UPI003C70D6BE